MDSYCPIPWVGINVLLPDLITPCCQWEGKCIDADDVEVVDQSIIEKGFEQIRQDMLSGKRIKNCEQCYAAEKIGAYSERLAAIERYGRTTKIELKRLDINFDNVCNLKCRGCSTTSSHIWTEDEKLIYGKPFVNKKFAKKEIDINLDNLERISVSGGEPFLSKQFDRMAQDILSKGVEKNIEITVDTNATILPPQSIRELFLRSKKATFSVSMDGIHELQEYYRNGSKFDQCISNIHNFVEMISQRNDEAMVNIHTTVNVYNVNRLQEIKDYFAKEFSGKTTFTHRVLYWPEHMSIKNLPKDYKETLLNIVKGFDNQFTDIVRELETEGNDYFDHFLNFHNILDKSRNESMERANPLLYEYINNRKYKQIDSTEFFERQHELLRE
jgi:sulfatase maturation enzyme AslB (radical SAM superfamily)